MKADYKNWMPVGCGSGALSIAVAKRNPNAEIIGIDRWGKEYASFSKNLCENNSVAEGVSNTSFQQGDAFAIHDIMSKAKYGDMESFVKKLKDMGYEEVKLVDTTNGMFMSKWESTWMALTGSALLMGRK